jgi:dTDP-glucose 4,6-dehydratase
MFVLVTGGAGFIGAHFARMAARHPGVERVLVVDAFTYASSMENLVDRPRSVEVEHGNVRDSGKMESVFRNHPITHVVHMAAETHVDRSISDGEPFVRTNVMGTANVLAAARKRQPMFVYVSTDEVYGTVLHAVREDAPLRPSSPYSASKAAGELLCMAEHRTFGTPVAITRGTNTYGPGQHCEKLIPHVVRCVMRREPVPIYGDGLQCRDWIHVHDHCSAIWSVLTRATPGEAYNVGVRNVRSNLDIIRTICSIIAEEGGPQTHKLAHVVDRKGHDRGYAVDPSKLEQLLEWEAKTPFDLRSTVTHYMDREKV